MTDLIDHERRLWIESAEAYDELCDPRAIMILPLENGILHRDKAIESLDKTPRWEDVEFSKVEQTEVADGTILLSYEAEAKGKDRGYRALCSSLWLTGGEAERIVHHQQTPLPEA